MYEPKDYKLVWNDEFDGDNLDCSKWVLTENMIARPDMCLSKAPEVISVSDGELHLNGISFSDPDNPEIKYATTYSVTTKTTMSFLYGYIEMRAKVPFKKGAWPSFWMVNNGALNADLSSGYATEIDIFEVFSSTDTLYPNLHKWYLKDGKHIGHACYDGIRDENGNLVKKKFIFENSEQLSNEYHIYGFKWTPEVIEMYIDGEQYMSFDMSCNFDAAEFTSDMSGFKQPVFLLLNNHIYTPALVKEKRLKEENFLVNDKDLPMEYSIDYIRLYQEPNTGIIHLK